jgi:hypothetical protein
MKEIIASIKIPMNQIISGNRYSEIDKLRDKMLTLLGDMGFTGKDDIVFDAESCDNNSSIIFYAKIETVGIDREI